MQQPFKPYFDPAKLLANELIGHPIGQKLATLWITETFSEEDAKNQREITGGYEDEREDFWIRIPLVWWDKQTNQDVFNPDLQFLEPYIEDNEEMWICWYTHEETGELTSWWITGNNA